MASIRQPCPPPPPTRAVDGAADVCILRAAVRATTTLWLRLPSRQHIRQLNANADTIAYHPANTFAN